MMCTMQIHNYCKSNLINTHEETLIDHEEDVERYRYARLFWVLGPPLL